MKKWTYTTKDKEKDIYRLAKKNGELIRKNEVLRKRLKPHNTRIAWGIICFGLLTCIMAYLCFFCFQAGYEIKNLENSFSEGSGLIQEGKATTSTMSTSLESNIPTLAGRVFEGARVSAYTTNSAEGTNCISASGKNICERYYQGEKLAACPPQLKIAEPIKDNGYSGFTKGDIVEINGIKYECVDRMSAYHRQFDDHFDIYVGRGELAIQKANEFGIQYLDVYVYE